MNTQGELEANLRVKIPGEDAELTRRRAFTNHHAKRLEGLAPYGHLVRTACWRATGVHAKELFFTPFPSFHYSSNDLP
jgi:hypothetical protein